MCRLPKGGGANKPRPYSVEAEINDSPKHPGNRGLVLLTIALVLLLVVSVCSVFIWLGFIVHTLPKTSMAESLSKEGFDDLTMVDAVKLLRSGEITSKILVVEAIRRATAMPELNAIAFLNKEESLEAARAADLRLSLAR